MRSAFYFLLFPILLSTCIGVIDFPVNEKSYVVIYGQLTNLDEPHLIQVARSSIYGKPPQPVSGALIELRDGSSTYPAVEVKPGQYLVQGLTKGVSGEAYSLSVRIGSKTYLSQPETLPMSVGRDSAYHTFSNESVISNDGKRVVRLIYVHSKSTIPRSANMFVRWEVEENYYFDLTDFPDPFNTPPPPCYASDRVNPQKINLVNAAELSGPEIDQQLVSREIDFTFKSRHYFTVRQLSITSTCHTYWRKVREVLNNRGSPFDSPPATVIGNFYNPNDQSEKVLGYFEVANVSYDRFFLVPGWIPFYLEPYCEYDPEKPFDKYPAVCIDCGKLPNGSGTGPPWFGN